MLVQRIVEKNIYAAHMMKTRTYASHVVISMLGKNNADFEMTRKILVINQEIRSTIIGLIYVNGK